MRLASDLEARSAQAPGAMLAVARLWSELGLDTLFRRVGRGRKVEFDLERAVFVMVANRVLDPGSKRGLRSWIETVTWPEGEIPELHHLYRSLDVLADAKDDLEVRLHQRVRDLFNQELDLVSTTRRASTPTALSRMHSGAGGTLPIPLKWPTHSAGSGPGIPEEVAHPFRGKRPGHRSEATLAA